MHLQGCDRNLQLSNPFEYHWLEKYLLKILLITIYIYFLLNWRIQYNLQHSIDICKRVDHMSKTNSMILHWVISECSVSIQWAFSECSVSIQWALWALRKVSKIRYLRLLRDTYVTLTFPNKKPPFWRFFISY